MIAAACLYITVSAGAFPGPNMAGLLPDVVLQTFGIITHPKQGTTNFGLLDMIEPRNRIV